MAFTDVFQRTTDRFGGAFAADKAKLNFPSVTSVANQAGDFGLLIQRLQTTYQQQVTRLYEVGRPSVYYVGGRTSGDSNLDRVIGPKGIQKNFYTQFGDVCNALKNTMEIKLEGGCGESGHVDDATGKVKATGTGLAGSSRSYISYFNVITSVGISVQAQDMVINENVRLMFSSFNYT